MCDLMSDLVICKFRKKYGHDTECPYWDQVSVILGGDKVCWVVDPYIPTQTPSPEKDESDQM